MTWFSEIISREVERRNGANGRGGREQLAREWEVDASQLSRWAEGQLPRLDAIEFVLGKIGGNIKWALPRVENRKSARFSEDELMARVEKLEADNARLRSVMRGVADRIAATLDGATTQQEGLQDAG